MKYKRIRGVAHNLGHSFMSDANAVMRDEVYTIVPAALFKAAEAMAVSRVSIDLLTATVEPPELALPEVSQSLAFYRNWLPTLLNNNGVDATAIRAATILITFDYSRARRSVSQPSEQVPEFTCKVRLTDDRGVVHEAEPADWWRA
jgi:hypothetical protein